jgi:hypothetical protein
LLKIASLWEAGFHIHSVSYASPHRRYLQMRVSRSRDATSGPHPRVLWRGHRLDQCHRDRRNVLLHQRFHAAGVVPVEETSFKAQGIKSLVRARCEHSVLRECKGCARTIGCAPAFSRSFLFENALRLVRRFFPGQSMIDLGSTSHMQPHPEYISNFQMQNSSNQR